MNVWAKRMALSVLVGTATISATACSVADVHGFLNDVRDFLLGKGSSQDSSSTSAAPPSIPPSAPVEIPVVKLDREILVTRNGAHANADFFAIKESERQWKPLTGEAGAYRFKLEHDREFEWIVVCVGVDGVPHGYYKNHHAKFYPTQLLDPVSIECQHDVPTIRKKVTGRMAGAFSQMTFSMGDRSVDVTSANPEFFIEVNPGIYDALIRGTNDMGAAKIGVVRDISVSAELDLGAIDVSTLRDPATRTVKYRYGGVLPGRYDPDYRGAEARFYGRGGTDVRVGVDSKRDGEFSFDALPYELRNGQNILRPDFYAVTLMAGGLQDPTDQRAHVFVSTDPEDKTFYQLPNKLTKPAFGGSPRLEYRWTDYESGVLDPVTLLSYATLVYVLDVSRKNVYDWNVDLATALVGTSVANQFAFPDLSEIAGWQPAWTPDNLPDAWTFTAYTGDIYGFMKLFVFLDDDLTGAAAQGTGP
jgi:hypothetical protein